MIDFIRGHIAYHTTEYVVVEANGVGYRLFCPNPFQWTEGEEVRIFTHQVVREDAHTLYGFPDADLRDCFRLLLEVSGIGPKVALAVVGAGSPAALVEAVEREDLRFLTKLPGIGKKTAQRLILDLKDKLKKASWAQSLSTEAVTTPSTVSRALSSDVIEALTALGYNEEEASVAVDEARRSFADEEPSLDDWIRRALQISIKG
ncbi:Holliday junction branch migration protein RuvA [Desmospora activa]|uniref:Holliday junction branch migration complex subunit RuvA n=1 Tax=Desmospora activa DSM 45169 TaxID=1121389 RepID=A0A2T4Z8U8_9BACL|nr:Holliday junction branch migration protein RuvA [Desmospora activa]PTM58321.1 Holliday junction DNA helicase subunit RuvA [Desmospora activa DSM 45169]